MVRVLIEAGADLNGREVNGATTLFFAMCNSCKG